MIPLKVRIDKTEIKAVFIAADGYPMPGETFAYDGKTYTVHTVAHAWINDHQAVVATADRSNP